MPDSDNGRFTPRCSRWERRPFQPPVRGKRRLQPNGMLAISYVVVLCFALVAVKLGAGPQADAGSGPDGPAAGTSQADVSPSSGMPADGMPQPHPAPSETPDGGMAWNELQLTEEDLGQGELILVNNEYHYAFPQAEELASVEAAPDGSYSVVGDQQLKPQMLEALGRLLGDFQQASGGVGISILSTYRTYEFQQSLLEMYTRQMGAELAARWSAQPGGSEHHTGLAADLGTPSGGFIDGTGVYSWIGQNCHTYGLVRRYAADKIEMTGFYDEPWHLRYVGVPHAALMVKNGFCLEEYIDWLRGFPWDGEHLRSTGESGAYEIYFVPAAPSGPVTRVPVPAEGEYTVSGNNVDGFIVTIHTEG